MIIKKCDVCKKEVDALYDKDIATHTDIITGIQSIKQEKLHICRDCMVSVTKAELVAQLGWYEDNVKDNSDTETVEPINSSTENQQGDSGDAEGHTENPYQE